MLSKCWRCGWWKNERLQLERSRLQVKSIGRVYIAHGTRWRYHHLGLDGRHQMVDAHVERCSLAVQCHIWWLCGNLMVAKLLAVPKRQLSVIRSCMSSAFDWTECALTTERWKNNNHNVGTNPFKFRWWVKPIFWTIFTLKLNTQVKGMWHPPKNFRFTETRILGFSKYFKLLKLVKLCGHRLQTLQTRLTDVELLCLRIVF